MAIRRFTFQDGSSNKFWEIELAENSLNVRFGRVGSDGQSQTKTFASAADAKKQYDKLVSEKTKKGYVEEKLNVTSAISRSNKVTKTSTLAKATKPSSPKTKSVSAKTAQANTGYSGQIALDKLADAVARSDAKVIASMFDGVSEAERARVRAALLEIHGIFGWNESAIKPAALKKYTPEECKKKCASNFECFVVVAIGGPRDDLLYARSRVSHLWKKEVHQLLRGRPVDWLRKLLSENSEIDEWRELVDEGVLPQVLDDLAVRCLLNGFYQDASATVIKSIYKSYPWISDVVYRIYSFDNWVVNASNFADRLSCLYAFIEFLSDKKILDRKKLIGCVLNGIHQVPQNKHVGACILILEYLEPTIDELVAHQGVLCSALTMGTPNSHDYLLKQMDRCSQEKKFDSTSASSAIASILPQASVAVAKQALQMMAAWGQQDSRRTTVLSAMAQSLLHTKREIAELGLKTLQLNFSSQDRDAIQAINQVLPHCSQVIKKQANVWLASPPQQLSSKQVATPTKTKAPTKTKKASSKSITDIPRSEPLQRSPVLIKTFRDCIPSLAISPLVDCHLWTSNYYRDERSVSTRDLYHKLIATHFGLPYFQTAVEIQKKINSNFDTMRGGKESSWWEVWSNSLTAAVATGEAKQAQQIAEWFSFGRRETSYDFQKPSPGICYLTVLLANRLRTKKLDPNKAMQSAMIRDKNAKGWVSVYQALESNDEDEFLKLFSKAAVKHVRQFETDIKAGKSYRTDPVSEIGTLMWHAGESQGFDVHRLDNESMAVIMTKGSLVSSGKADPRDQLRLPVSKDRITQSLKILQKLLVDCEIPFAITTPIDDDNELKIYRWQLVADISEEAFERLYQAHDPFQIFLNRKIFDPQRDYEMPLLIDLKNGVVLNHVKLSKAATEQALSKATSKKQNGVAIPTCCVEHLVALASPVVDRLRKELAASNGKLQNRMHDCTRCADYSARIIKMTIDKTFDWKVAEQLASRIPGAKVALAAIQRGEKVPPRFNSLLRMARD